jgi:hypothetical protein
VSERGLAFLERWIDRNILTPAFYTIDVEMREALAQNCIDDARREGIARHEMEEDVGSLSRFLGDMMEHESGMPTSVSGTPEPPVE